MWEDPANAEGGKWVLTVKDDESILDNAWEELVSFITYVNALHHMYIFHELCMSYPFVCTNKKTTVGLP